jgi:hypothetical protein
MMTPLITIEIFEYQLHIIKRDNKLSISKEHIDKYNF